MTNHPNELWLGGGNPGSARRKLQGVVRREKRKETLMIQSDNETHGDEMINGSAQLEIIKVVRS